MQTPTELFEKQKEELQQLVQNVLKLTQEDEIIWSFESSSLYTAVYEDVLFQLNCSEQEPYFRISFDEYRIGRMAVNQLCCEIAKQSVRLKGKSSLIDLERVNKTLRQKIDSLSNPH